MGTFGFGFELTEDNDVEARVGCCEQRRDAPILPGVAIAGDHCNWSPGLGKGRLYRGNFQLPGGPLFLT